MMPWTTAATAKARPASPADPVLTSANIGTGQITAVTAPMMNTRREP